MAAAQQISYKMGAEEPSAFFPADADAAEKGTQQGIVIDPLTGFHFLQTHADFASGTSSASRMQRVSGKHWKYPPSRVSRIKPAGKGRYGFLRPKL